MAFKYIQPSATGNYQIIRSRLVETNTIDLISDTPHANSVKAIPFDGTDDELNLDNWIILHTFAPSATIVAFDGFVKPAASAVGRNNWFNMNVLRNVSAMTSAFDGHYESSIVQTGGNKYVEFSIEHDIRYTLTSMSTISTSSWSNIFCSYLSGDQKMQIWVNGLLDREGALNSASVSTASTNAVNGIRFNGKLDELRMWVASGAASSMTKLTSASSIGLSPATIGINEFQPTGSTLAAYWRFETLSAFQLFLSITDSITDDSGNGNHLTPSGFQGADNVANETTIIFGLSASGDLINLDGGGSLDHGGMTLVDPDGENITLEMGGENLIRKGYNTWLATGSNVSILSESQNIYYGASAIRISTLSADTGVYQEISNSALLFDANAYTCSLRYRSISGSVSARVSFYLGTTVTAVTAVTDTVTWKPVILRNTLRGTATGKIEVIQLNSSNNAGALFQVDGLFINEGDFPASFLSEGRLRKSGELSYLIVD